MTEPNEQEQLDQAERARKKMIHDCIKHGILTDTQAASMSLKQLVDAMNAFVIEQNPPANPCPTCKGTGKAG